MFFIREFREDDLSDVYEIALRNLTERYTPELFLDIYRSWPRGFLVAVVSRIVGFIAGTKDEHAARILMLAVDKQYRNRGIGTSLLDRFIANCKSEGVVSVSLEVRTNNKIAVEFYQKRGFQIVSFLPDYYTNGDDAYIMWRMI